MQTIISPSDVYQLVRSTGDTIISENHTTSPLSAASTLVAQNLIAVEIPHAP